MKLPEAFVRLWHSRGSAHPHWLSEQYERAAERVQDRTNDHPQNRYYCNSAETHSVMLGEPLVHDDAFGGYTSPDVIRKEAFEMLVLADLAEIQAVVDNG